MIVARTYKTLSLSMPPDVVRKLDAVGKPTGRVAARVAADIVLREIAAPPVPKDADGPRNASWCCMTRVLAVRGQLVVPEALDGTRRWMPVTVLLCDACGKQLHGREYEGWLADA